MSSPPLALTLFRTARPPFLVLMPVSILLGIAVALAQQGSVDVWLACLVMVGGLLAHIAVNTLNEYQDFNSGLDLRTCRTPFSGGSGALPEHPAAAPAVLGLSLTCLLLTALTGLYLVAVSGPGLLPVGCLGLAVVVSYTRWLNRNPWACLLAPGLAFGPLVVMGTCYVLTEDFPAQALWASLLPMCLASNLLLVNQFPDLEADRAAGRRHLIIVHGPGAGVYAYGLLSLMATMVVILGVVTGILPRLGLISLLPLALCAAVLSGLRSHLDDRQALQHYLGLNVLVTLLAPTVLAICLLFDAGLVAAP